MTPLPGRPRRHFGRPLPRRRLSCLLMLAAGLLLAVDAPARTLARDYGLEPGTRFALTVAHERFDFRLEDGGRAETRVTRAEGSLVQPVTHWFQPGIVLGAAVLSQRDNPVTAGLDPVLWLAGLTLDSHWPLAGPLSLELHGAGVYHRTEAAERRDTDDPEADVTLDWFELRGRALLRADLGQIRLAAGGYLLALEGDQRQRGEVRLTEGLSLEGSAGAYGEFGVQVDRSGWVTLGLEVGARDALRVQFLRRF